ncbi:hypothetical protein NLG97_g531 [Lecanicillium saksenae]|uniref:Uncharacterized protein n=1 Tax=Lecanicillium saksenae TaxID=468837 RepID=A0ACC1R7J9_9HYPO|nr:hypothetical protein NLG97_g531 [Lecanicillium saksenae]
MCVCMCVPPFSPSGSGGLLVSFLLRSPGRCPIPERKRNMAGNAAQPGPKFASLVLGGRFSFMLSQSFLELWQQKRSPSDDLMLTVDSLAHAEPHSINAGEAQNGPSRPPAHRVGGMMGYLGWRYGVNGGKFSEKLAKKEERTGM